MNSNMHSGFLINIIFIIIFIIFFGTLIFLYYFWDSIGLCCAGCCKKCDSIGLCCAGCCKKCDKKNEKTSTVNLTGASSDGAASYKSVPLDESLSF